MSTNEYNILVSGSSNDSNLILESRSSNIGNTNNSSIIKDLTNKIKNLETTNSQLLINNSANGIANSYMPGMLFRLTETGVAKWKSKNMKTYNEAKSPLAGTIGSLYDFRRGPFEFPTSLLPDIISGESPVLEIVGISNSIEYANNYVNNAFLDQVIAEPTILEKEEYLYASDFVYNSINEFQGNDPFNILKPLDNNEPGFKCDMSEFNDTGGSSNATIISKKCYKNYEFSYNIKIHPKVIRYRDPILGINNIDSVTGLYFGCPYDPNIKYLKGVSGRSGYQLEFKGLRGNSDYEPNSFMMTLIPTEGLDITDLESLSKIKEPVNYREPYLEANKNYKDPINIVIRHFENKVKIKFNDTVLIYKSVVGTNETSTPEIDNNQGCFGIQVENCSLEITDLKIKPITEI